MLFAVYNIYRTPKSPPEANFDVSSTTVNVEEFISFSANTSTDQDGRVVNYYWNFGDGTHTTGKYVTHSYEEGGNYTVILIISDDDNIKSFKDITVNVNFPPVPVINITEPAYIHEDVIFLCNNSYDPDGRILDYIWRFGDGEEASGEDINNLIRHTYRSLGIFNGQLTVIDNLGASTTKPFQVEVINRTYRVTWKETSSDSYWNRNFNLEEEDSHVRSRDISNLNMTKIMFNLTWTDDRPSILPEGGPNDLFNMNVTTPEGYSQELSEDENEMVLLIFPEVNTFNDIPQNFEYSAETIEALESILAEMHTSNNGIGEWELNITLVDARGFGGTDPGDNDNTFDLEVTVFYYVPEIIVLE
jgi:PKD repeat protein